MKLYKMWTYKGDPVNEHFSWLILDPEYEQHWEAPGYDCRAKGKWRKVKHLPELFQEMVEYETMHQCLFGNRQYVKVTIEDLLEESSILEYLILMGPLGLDKVQQLL